MSLYVRLDCNFFTHRKTAKLRAALGDDALWLAPRLWAYAAENQPNGCFKDYSAAELGQLLGYGKDAKRMLEALLHAGFLDSNPLRIHGWAEYNGYHAVFAARAKHAAEVRWQKERTKEKGHDRRGEEASIASSIGRPSITRAKGTGETHPPPPEMWKLRKDLRETRAMLKDERAKGKPDQGIIDGCEAEVDKLKGAIAEYGRTNRKQPSRPVRDSKPVRVGQVIATAASKPGQFGGVGRERWNQLAAQARGAVR
jgi:hypothetical protein